MSEKLSDLDFKLGQEGSPSEAVSDINDELSALPKPDFASEDVQEDAESELAQAGTEISVAEASVRVPDEDTHEDDKLLQSLGKESVRAHYNFINVFVLTLIFMTCALTLLLIRQGERYGEDNAQLTLNSFIDGSYTQQLSDKYIGDSKLQAVVKKLGEVSGYFYGFSLESEKDETITRPDDKPDSTVTTTGTVTSAATTTETTTTTMSYNPDVTGTPISVEPQGSDTGSGDIFTGNVITTTPSLTTSFTTTMSYSHTASKTEGTKAPDTTTSEATTTTKKGNTTTKRTTTTRKPTTTTTTTTTSQSDTEPSVSDSETTTSESTTSVTTTPVSSEEPTETTTTSPTDSQPSGE